MSSWTHRRRSWPGRTSLARIYRASGPRRRPRGPMPSTRCSSSVSTSPAGPIATSRRDLWHPHTRAPHPVKFGFAFDRSGYRVRRSWCLHGSPGDGLDCQLRPRPPSTRPSRRGVEPRRAVHRPGCRRAYLREAAQPPRGATSTRDLARHCDPLPVPLFQAENVQAMRALGTLGRHLCHGLYEHARHDRDLPDPTRLQPQGVARPGHRLRRAARVTAIFRALRPITAGAVNPITARSREVVSLTRFPALSPFGGP